MKRKNSYSATEASFDTLMANTSECNTSKKVNFEGGSSPNSSLIKRAQFDLIRSEVSYIGLPYTFECIDHFYLCRYFCCIYISICIFYFFSSCSGTNQLID